MRTRANVDEHVAWADRGTHMQKQSRAHSSTCTRIQARPRADARKGGVVGLADGRARGDSSTGPRLSLSLFALRAPL
eukprot:5336996-Pleurochrysis_carterae.AAC.1